MAFTCGFFNSVNHDRKYDAVQHGMIFDGIITDGIYATYLKAMVVKASSNPSEVIVQPGRAWFNHTWSYNDADYPVAAPDPEVVLDRIDTLVLDVNNEDAVRNCQFLWVQGTPTSQVPEPPELIHTVTHNQYPLCDVYRQAGTTQIYAADITNRVGTSDCPFVTGVLEGINIDDLLAQWDDEFHTWENATKASFEGWMLNQQAVYSAWWDSLKTQMAGDVADVEEWVQTIKDIIDEETATHLQLEIDEINSMLPSGSHITVTTADTELYSRAVTITDEDDNTVASQFDATGVAVFKSVPYVGNLTIEATDGIRTATAVVETPYFARYEFPLAFWSATVNITGGTELGGETVTITDSSQLLVGTVVLNASGIGVFNATYPDTYKFSVTHGGQTMEVSLAVTQETTYNVTIHAGFNWRGWVDTAQYLDSSDYNSLDEVLADELAVRELCLEHACVDYLAAVPSVNTDIETIINNDLFAKWVNNSDYSLDVLGANVAIRALMDTADKYGYGEWCLMPQVPTMTANNAPYGEAFAISEQAAQGHAAFRAFDGDDSTFWVTNSHDSQYLGYHFVNPIVLRNLKLRISPSSANESCPLIPVYVQGSNDGQNWDTLHSFNIQTARTLTITEYDEEFSNSTPYSYYMITSSVSFWVASSYAVCVNTLQFYAWQPKGNVPVMTANNAPYGEASGNPAGSSSAIYYAFDNNDSTQYFASSSGTTHYVGYKFANPINVKRFVFGCTFSDGRTVSLQVSYSDDGTNFTNAGSAFSYVSSASVVKTAFDLDDDYGYHLYWRVTRTMSTSGYNIANTLQFYGRELKGNVPKMTSNTAPYGTVIYSTQYIGSSNYLGYYAFDDAVTGNGWTAGTSDSFNNAYIGYTFLSPICIKRVRLYMQYNYTETPYPTATVKIQGSNDGTNWDDLSDVISLTAKQVTYVDLDNDNKYLSYRMRLLSTDTGAVSRGNGYHVQFYDNGYSEKEFESGTTKKWLYDHGVEVTPLTLGNAENKGSYIYMNGESIEIKPTANLDLTPYSIIRAILSDDENTFGQYAPYLGINNAADTQQLAKNVVSSKYPYLDCTSVNETVKVYFANDTYKVSVAEWWLE